jgi:predicted CXXCH cytochrome family protein
MRIPPATLLLCTLALTVAPPLSAQEAETPAHKPLEITEDAVIAGTGEQATSLESITAYCLGCHEEGMAPGAPEPKHAIGSLETNHPVEVTYPEGDSSYVAPDQLGPELRLVSGQMVCITCHDPDTLEHGLTIPNERSRLCIACHRK